ncbi:MAG: DsbC family protein, partial [Actinobacteria bacterium]|nr:DsbC family protein [Actinomycetota bacterium]
MKTLAFFSPRDLALAVALTLAAIAVPVLAETAQEAQVRRLVQPHVMDKIDSVTKTPYLGLFEVRMGHDIVYTDASATYLFNGNIVNAKTSQDY